MWHANHALVKARRACGIDAQRRCIRRQVSGPSPFLLVGVWTHPPYNTVAYAAMKACAPAKPAAPVVSGTSGSTTSLDESWTAPAIDNYDLRYRQGTWDETAIEDRAQDLAAVACRVWPRPQHKT